MRRYIICLTALLLFLTGCGLQKGGSVRQDFSDFGQNVRMMFSSKGVKADKTLSDKEISSSEYAYVVGSFYGRNEWLHTGKCFGDSWKDDEIVELPFTNQNFSLSYDENPRFNYNIYKIKPGRYTLVTFMSAPKNNVFYRSIDPDREKNDQIREKDSVYASFEAKAGELTYVGDMNVTGLTSMVIKDNSTEVVTYLSEFYENINNPQKFMKKNLAKKGIRFREESK